MKTISLKALNKRKYKTFDFKGAWRDSLGCPEVGARCIIYGHSGAGKTDFAVQLTKYMSSFGRVLYFSKEQADKNSISLCFQRHELMDNKKVSLAIDGSFDDLIAKLSKKNHYKTIVVDSIDYLQMTTEQYKQLDKIKNKFIIFISWQEGRKPKSSAGKAIEYMVDIKIQVDSYVAFVRSRYEGNAPFIIWEKGAKDSLKHAFLNI